MGKQRRFRQKYHLTANKSSNETSREVKQTGSNLSESSLQWNVQPTENMFAGLDIDVTNLKNSLMDIDDDGRSVKSIAKSIKSCSGRQLKKEDKRKLRHNLFISKIDAIYATMKKSKKSKKNKSMKEKAEVNLDENKSTVEYLLEKNPAPIKKTPHTSVKQGGIKKAKERKKDWMKDIELFKKISANPKFTANPLEHIKSTVEEKVLADIV